VGGLCRLATSAVPSAKPFERGLAAEAQVRYTAELMPNLLLILAALFALACAAASISPPTRISLQPEQVERCQSTLLLDEPPAIASYWDAQTFRDDPGQIVANWYSPVLCAMGEAPLALPDEIDSLRFRFLWIRSFDPPISVRIEKDGPRVVLYATQLESPREDYAPGSVTRRESRELSPREWENFSRTLSQSDLWNARSAPHTCCDGAQWVFEVAEADRYHVVDLLSGGDLRPLGEAALSLSGLEPTDIY